MSDHHEHQIDNEIDAFAYKYCICSDCDKSSHTSLGNIVMLLLLLIGYIILET